MVMCMGVKPDLEHYTHLNSPLHRWEPRAKLIGLMILMFAFACVQDLRLLPAMVAVTSLLFWFSQLPLAFLLSRFRYAGFFLLAMILLLPFLSGDQVIWQWGSLAIYQEGSLAALLISGRFFCIFTLSLLLLGTTPFLTTIKAMRSLGLPVILSDMTLLAYRYLHEIGDDLQRMQQAMRLRAFQTQPRSRVEWRTVWTDLNRLASLAGTLLIRSYEQSERVYKAMRLRGYGWGQGSHPSAGITDEAIEIRDLCFSYPDHPHSLRNLTLQVKQGERVGVIGPNGAGKTTCFLALCGLLQPAQGEIQLCGRRVVPGRFCPEVGLVFQNPNDQLFSASVWEDVAFGPHNLGLHPAAIEERVQEALALTGVVELAHRPPHHLSGGEKRMVAIAGVLAMRPQIMIYDEPSANLDMRARRRLIQFLQASHQTLLISSHDLEFILEICERVILMDAGQIVADGPSRQIMGNRALMESHHLEKPHSLLPHSHGIGS
jgi:cobalt/nickel transport system ATP-binding protein